MKIAKGLIPLLVLIFAVSMIIGCSHSDKSDVEGVITNELNLLKNLDSDTAQKYISYQELFPDATEKTELSKEVEDVFSLFFEDFDYKIQRIKVAKDKKEASANLKLTTIDAQALAKDYAVSHLENAILLAAASSSQNTEENSGSLEDRYLILSELLKNNQYHATVISNIQSRKPPLRLYSFYSKNQHGFGHVPLPALKHQLQFHYAIAALIKHIPFDWLTNIYMLL